MEPDAAEKELWHYDMTPDAKAAWDANGMDGAVTGESPVIVSFTTMGYDRGYRVGAAASPSEELVGAAEAHLAAEDVMLGLISVGGFGKRDAAVVAKWVESCGALEDALAALRTTKEEK